MKSKLFYEILLIILGIFAADYIIYKIYGEHTDFIIKIIIFSISLLSIFIVKKIKNTNNNQ